MYKKFLVAAAFSSLSIAGRAGAEGEIVFVGGASISGDISVLEEGLDPDEVQTSVKNSPLFGLRLGAYGMPGCELLVEPTATLALGLSSAAGASRWITPLPRDAGLVGVEFFQQSLCLAAGANPAGVIWSNGGHGTIGTF